MLNFRSRRLYAPTQRAYSDMWSTLLRIRTRWLFVEFGNGISARQALSLNVTGSWGFAKEPHNQIARSARWNGAQLFGAFVCVLHRETPPATLRSRYV